MVGAAADMKVAAVSSVLQPATRLQASQDPDFVVVMIPRIIGAAHQHLIVLVDCANLDRLPPAYLFFCS